MKKLFQLSILVSTILVTSAFAGIKLKAPGDCTQNPDMFININGALGSNVSINEMAGYYGVNGTTQKFDYNVSDGGNTPQLVGIDGNSACMKKAGATSLQLALTALTTNQQAKTSIANCEINVPVQRAMTNLFIKWNPNSQSYYCVYAP